MDPEEIVTWETYEYVMLDDVPKPHSIKNNKVNYMKGKKRLHMVKKQTSMRVFLRRYGVPWRLL